MQRNYSIDTVGRKPSAKVVLAHAAVSEKIHIVSICRQITENNKQTFSTRVRSTKRHRGCVRGSGENLTTVQFICPVSTIIVAIIPQCTVDMCSLWDKITHTRHKHVSLFA